MRILILGCTGMAGHMMAFRLMELGHEVTGSYRRNTPVLEALCNKGMRSILLDCSDSLNVASVINSLEYDAIVNCVGLLNRACDESPALAIRLNSLLPHRLEALSANTECRIVHISTDCVFAGDSGAYSEDSEPDGLTLYDLTKAAGELRNSKDITLRQSIIGPDPNPSGIGLLNWFMSQDGPISGYSHAMWTGLTTLELANAVDACINSSFVGLVNMVPENNISKLNLLNLFNASIRSEPIEIKPLDDVVIDKTLLRTNMTNAFRPLCYEQQIVELSSWIYSHKEIYPHYKLG